MHISQHTHNTAGRVSCYTLQVWSLSEGLERETVAVFFDFGAQGWLLPHVHYVGFCLLLVNVTEVTV